MGWDNGRNLVSASGGGKSITYGYSLNGLRTSKTVGGVTHNYLYASGKLLRETYGSNTLDFFYDADGRPYALKYNGTVYYYITNLQGDVIQLVNASDTVVATYDYDPYGKVISATGTMADINPLCYRGYYYDSDLDMYYLQSRYYDPTIARFINADAYASTGQGIIGHNMFAYCGNNPVTRTDIGGYFWDTVLDVISLGVSIANVIENPDDPMAWLGVAADVASLVVPCVSGGGALVRSATKADDVVDAFKAADNLGEVGEVIVKYGDEVKLPNQIKANGAVDAWDDFLGPNQTSYNRFTGTNEMDRIFSADGTRSIRFDSHEMRSIGTTKAHFHYENWLFDPASNTVYVENILQRLK